MKLRSLRSCFCLNPSHIFIEKEQLLQGISLSGFTVSPVIRDLFTSLDACASCLGTRTLIQYDDNFSSGGKGLLCFLSLSKHVACTFYKLHIIICFHYKFIIFTMFEKSSFSWFWITCHFSAM